MPQAVPACTDQHHQPGRSAEQKLKEEAVRSRVEIGNELQHLTTTRLKANPLRQIEKKPRLTNPTSGKLRQNVWN